MAILFEGKELKDWSYDELMAWANGFVREEGKIGRYDSAMVRVVFTVIQWEKNRAKKNGKTRERLGQVNTP